MFVGSFAFLILLGTCGLKWLPGLYTGEPLNWLDALFTSTSAVCVTGLIVVDTATFFTPAGQAVILLLIQLGGLGMLTFASLILVALGRRLSLRAEATSIAAADHAPHVDRRRLALDIVRFTLAIEALGALVLYALWLPQMGTTGAIWPAVFHSVSAFCNAGFSTFSDSLIGSQNSPMILLVIGGLIVAGGLGFLTHEELMIYVTRRRRQQAFRMSLQSRIVLLTTLALIVAGWIPSAVFEWNGCLKDQTIPCRLVNSLFISITARTAGFNSIDYGLASDNTNLTTILLMTVGGSPGSTAGGIKTTTLALIGLMAWSRLRGLEETTFLSRSIPEETTSRAVGLFVFATGIAVAGVFLLTATEIRMKDEIGLMERLFEVSSAFNTVGLSMGITGKLSAAGRWVIILLMFIGRVGLLTLAAALTQQRSGSADFRYAYEDVVVG